MKPGWELKKFKDVCDYEKLQGFHKGLPYVGLENIESNTGRFLGSLAPQIVKSTTFLFSEDHVLYGRLRPYLNKVLLPDFKGHCSTEIFPIRVKEELLREYLFYWLTSDEVVSKIDATWTGARMPRANMNQVLEFDLAVPPLPEQQRIVSILDDAFAAIAKAKANAEQNLKNAKELFESYLQGVFEDGDWGFVKLAAFATDITDGDHMPPPKSDTGLPFITISNINKQTHKIDFSDTFKVPEKYYNSLKPNKKPQKGDVLYTVTGSYGIPVLIENDVNFCFQRHIGLIRPSNKLNSKLLYYWILSPQAFSQANETATGTAQKTVSLSSLRNFDFPSIPIQEQQSIVRRLDAIRAETQKLEAIYRKKLNDLDELKKSILQKAFKGELGTSDKVAV